MTPRHALDLAKNWREILLEVRLRAGAGFQTPVPVSFPVDQARLKRAYIEWPSHYAYSEAGNWVGALKLGLAAHLPVCTVEMPAARAGNEAVPITFRLVLESRTFPVTIDYCDYMNVIYQEQLRHSLVYFKMQYRRSGYSKMPASAKIVPGGYVNGAPYLYKYLDYIRAYGAQTGYTMDVFGRFGLTFAREIRENAHRLLSEQKHFRYCGGLVKRRYIQFLRECAEARICIDLPSNSDFCFRLTDYLAIGCCVIAPEHRTTLHVDLEHRKNIVHVARDLSDLVDTCRYYLEHDEEREAIRSASHRFFDEYLHRDQLAAYYLHTCLQRIGRHGGHAEALDKNESDPMNGVKRCTF
jgi:hypothetical protein